MSGLTPVWRSIPSQVASTLKRLVPTLPSWISPPYQMLALEAASSPRHSIFCRIIDPGVAIAHSKGKIGKTARVRYHHDLLS